MQDNEMVGIRTWRDIKRTLCDGNWIEVVDIKDEDIKRPFFSN